MRRLLSVGTSTAVVAVVVAGCGSGGSGSGNSGSKAQFGTSKVAAACKGKPTRGGSLVYSRQLEVASLNPRDIKNSNGDIFADEMLYNGLVRNDPGGSAKVQPALAQSWDISSDGKTYTFHLRPGLKFSDGTPVTSEDVVWNLEQFANPKVNISLASAAVGFKSARAVDATTVEVTLAHPVAAFINNVSIFPAFIVPKKAVQAQGSAFWKHPVGTGPFRLKEYAGGSHITFERNPYYFDAPRPYLDTMRWNFVTNPSTRILSLKSGESQIADGISFTQVESLSSDPKVAVQKVPVPQEVLLIPNTKKPGLDDLDVRKAINLALDRKQINQVVFKSTGSIPNSILMPFELDAGSDEVAPYAFDLAGAKAAMAKSKFPKGFSTTLAYPASLDSFKQMSLLIQQQLAKIGIKVKLVEQEAATLVSKWSSGQFDLIYPFPGTASDIPVPDEYATFYALPESGLHGFFSFWQNSQIESMVRKFTESTDAAARKQQWAAIQKGFNDQLPSFNVVNFPYLNAHGSNVCGTEVNGLGVDQLQQTWLSKDAS